MKRKWILRTIALLAACLSFAACAKRAEEDAAGWESLATSTAGSEYLTIASSEGSTVDPQCTSESYLIALNVFDRLVNKRTGADGTAEIVPALAESWEVSEDGYIYTFRLREGVTFSNGEPLTSSDVRYTMTRLLSHPNSCNSELASFIFGAEAVRQGTLQVLAGFNIHSDTEFAITLSQPYAPFLDCLAAPGASILDEQTTARAGARFGRSPSWTVGTGPFIIDEWRSGEEMLLLANPDYWGEPPRCAGVRVHVVADGESRSLLFNNGTLDILDLDGMGVEAEYYLRGEIYRDRLYTGTRVGIDYIALNASVPPLDDVRVRRALQLALDRKLLLMAVEDGRGQVENGIFPTGLTGHDPTLPEIPYDPDAARELLAEAGLENGFHLKISVSKSSSRSKRELLTLVASMWEKIGVQTTIDTVSDNVFSAMRKDGILICYTGRWSADFDDPDNFIYTFFGTEENTRIRSLFYGDEAVMRRIVRARGIADKEERMREYRLLERKIVQEDAAWIPLYSTQHSFIVNERVDGFRVPWNGCSDLCYRDVAVTP